MSSSPPKARTLASILIEVILSRSISDQAQAKHNIWLLTYFELIIDACRFWGGT